VRTPPPPKGENPMRSSIDDAKQATEAVIDHGRRPASQPAATPPPSKQASKQARTGNNDDAGWP